MSNKNMNNNYVYVYCYKHKLLHFGSDLIEYKSINIRRKTTKKLRKSCAPGV